MSDRTAPGVYALITWPGSVPDQAEHYRNLNGGLVLNGFDWWFKAAGHEDRLAVSPSSPIWYSRPAGEHKDDGVVPITALSQMRNEGLGAIADDILAGMRRKGGPLVSYIGGEIKGDRLLTGAKNNAAREKLIRADLDVWFDLGGVAFDVGSMWKPGDLMYRIARDYWNRGHRVIIEAWRDPTSTHLRDFESCCTESGFLGAPERSRSVVPNRVNTILCETDDLTAERAAGYRANGWDVAGVWTPEELRRAVGYDSPESRAAGLN